MATKSVNIDILAKDKTAKAMKSATDGVNRLKGQVQQSVATQQKSFNALGNTVRNVIGGVIVFQALRFSKQMVNMASSVEEMQSKSSVVFGRFVSDVRGQLEKFGDEVGRSTFELEEMASSIQDTFVPMGFARKEASKLSVQLTKLAVDVASFNNASDVDTMRAFQSALVGNHETVRRFGVVITEATLKQELLRMGITKTAKEVTNAEKVQARLNLIIAGTSDAQGDAERTNTSFANSMKALNAEFQEFMVEAITPMLPALSKMVQSLKDSIIQTKEFLRSIGLLSELNTIIPIVDQLGKNQDSLSIATAKLSKEIELLDAIQTMTFIEKNKEMVKANGKFGFSIMQGEKAVLKRIEALKVEIEQINLSKTAILIESDARVQVTNAINDEANALKKLNKQKKAELEIPLPKARPMQVGMGDFMGSRDMQVTQSMTGSETEFGMAKGMSKVGDIDALKAVADAELMVAEQTGLKRLEIADKTARGERNIRQNFINEQTAILKSGQFQDLKLTNLTEQQKKDTIIAGGKAILSSMAQNNKQAFKLNKALSMAEAFMNTAQGVTKALSTGNIPMAILIGALGAVQIATISQQKYQGRKQGGRMNQDQPYMVGEAGPELIVPNKASNVVPNHQLGGMGKAVTVNFNISTVDARGFNELLVNSRGTIVNLINSAVNEKGKMAII